MKKTTAIASFLFLATLTGIVQAAPQIATRAYVDSKTVQAGTDISVTDERTVNATYGSLQYNISAQDGLLPINSISQTSGKINVTTGAWGQVAQGEVVPASGGDVYAAIQEAIQEAIQNLEYDAGDGISITDGVIAAKGDPNKNIEVYPDGIGIAMESYDAETDDDNNPGLFDGTMRVTSIKQNNTGNIKVGVEKWNEQWSLNDAPIRTQRIKYELNRKTNKVIAGRHISVTEQNTTDVLTNNLLGEKNYTINSTLYPGTGIMFTTENCRGEGTCIALRTSSTSALSFNEDGELSLSGLSYDNTETDAGQRLANGTSRIASITQTDGIISVTTGDWVTSLENLPDASMGVPATAKAIVAAIKQSVAPVEETANNALRVANEAAANAAEALQAANNAIPKPDPNVCGAPGKRCVLTYGLNGNEMTYEWEVVTRADGEQ